MNNNIAKGSYLVFLEQIIVSFFGFIIVYFLSKSLSIKEYGDYTLMLNVLTFSLYLFSFGIEPALSRYIPIFILRREFALIKKIIFTSFLFRSVSFLLIFVSLLMLNNIFNFIHIDWFFSGYFGLFILLSILNSIFGGIMVGNNERYYLSYVRISSKILFLVFVIFLKDYSGSFQNILLFFTLISVIEFIYYVWYAINKVFNKYKKLDEHRNSSLRSYGVFSYAGYSWLNRGGQAFREYAVDSLVIAFYFSTHEVGLYAAGVMAPSMIRSFAPGRLLQGVLFSSFVRSDVGMKKNYEHPYILLQKINVITIIPIVLLSIVFISDLISLVYTDNYSGSISVAKILLLFVVFQALSDPIKLVCETAGMPKLLFYASLFGFVNLILDFVCIGRFGISGAAFATGFTGILVLIFYRLVLSRKADYNIWLSTKFYGTLFFYNLPLIATNIFIEICSLTLILKVSIALASLLVSIYLHIRSPLFTEKEVATIKTKLSFI